MIDERYAAGFFDGEGCIHIARNVRVVISGCFRPASWSNRSRRPGVRWEITGDNSDRFLRDVLPFLVEKKDQAVSAIAYRQLKKTFNVRGGKGFSDDQRKQIVAIEDEVRRQKSVVHSYSL